MNDVNVKFYIDKSIRAFFVNQIGSIINWTDDKIHQSNFYVFE